MQNDILKICKEKDIPFIWSIWNHLEENNEYEIAIKKYLARMKLKSFSNMTFKDSGFDWELDNSSYKDIIEYLLEALEEEHMGLGGVNRNLIKEKYGVEV